MTDDSPSPLQRDRRRIAGLAFMAALRRTNLDYQVLEVQWMGFVRGGGMASGDFS